ncbi:hypothetical protein AmaxDRAFT_5642 [Limnospira maxima CS-328]|uniref:Uncharacterized protein n=1 Tax=Limnospira maxima CS-328 TaxID=513049 RepID=B5WA42_LIMMA|nr:hypothetical protein AmaxDRAFT_5642 [Limnospira maxima CS-328]
MRSPTLPIPRQGTETRSRLLPTCFLLFCPTLPIPRQGTETSRFFLDFDSA